MPVNHASVRQLHALGRGKHSASDLVGARAAPILDAVFVAPTGHAIQLLLFSVAAGELMTLG
jgi:hypothetical protein